MIIEPKIRGFICITAHAAGCEKNVRNQIEYVLDRPGFPGAKKVLVIGASTGYGLASRISAAFGSGAATLGIIFDKPASGSRTASAGWYNTAAFEKFANQAGLYAKTINGDAFSLEVKEQAIELIKKDLSQIDMVIYSLAAPRRVMPDGTIYNSVLRAVDQDYENISIDLNDNSLSRVTISPATDEERDSTIKVMGGEDWQDWITALDKAGVLADQVTTVAYSCIGPELTHPIYLNGTIGMAKRHLYDTAMAMTRSFANVQAYISVNKALVTQASAAIPIVPLYISLLYKIMKEKEIHENCIQQIYRLYHDKLFVQKPVLDDIGQIRMDDLEMRPDVQQAVNELWNSLSNDNVNEICDISGYWEDFYQMFGFKIPGVDYEKEIDILVPIPSIKDT